MIPTTPIVTAATASATTSAPPQHPSRQLGSDARPTIACDLRGTVIEAPHGESAQPHHHDDAGNNEVRVCHRKEPDHAEATRAEHERKRVGPPPGVGCRPPERNSA